MATQIVNVKVISSNIQVLNNYITEGRAKTFLNANISAASGTITVFSINGFAQGNFYVLIGEIGSGNAEIIKIHASTAPTGNTITLAANTAYTHDANEPVYYLNYNQAEFSNEAVGVAAGTSGALATNDIDPTKKWTVYFDSANTTGIAYVRLKNEAGTTYTGYSAAAPYANEAFNTIEHMTNEALRESKQEYGGLITPDYLISQCNECLRDIRKYKNKLSWTQSFRETLGATAQGTFVYSLPSTIYDKYSFKAIDRVSLGGETELIKVDPNYFFNRVLNGVHYTQVTTAAVVTDTTLEIDNSYDFSDTGSVNVGGNTITYTGVTRSATAGVLTGVPASGTGAIPAAGFAVDDYVFQDETESEPKYFTLYNGLLYTYPLPDSTWDNFNVFIDYYKTVTSVDDMADAIDQIQYDMVKNWLKWKIRNIAKNDGLEDLNDPSYQLYLQQLGVQIKKDRPLNATYFRNNFEATNPTDYDVNPAQIRRGSPIS